MALLLHHSNLQINYYIEVCWCSGKGAVLVGATSNLPLHSSMGSHVRAYKLHLFKLPCLVRVSRLASSSAFNARLSVLLEFQPLLRMSLSVTHRSPLFCPL